MHLKPRGFQLTVSSLLLATLATTPEATQVVGEKKGTRPLTLQEVMTPEQLAATGVMNLKPAERTAFDTWLMEYTERVAKSAATLSKAPASDPVRWMKSEVVPVILVTPNIGGFKPVEGSAIGNTWTKADVRPVVIVEPRAFGFVPHSGSSIGNIWTKEDVLPVVLLESSQSGFVSLFAHSAPVAPTSADGQSDSGRSSQSAIESKVDGDFSGWEGETIVKLTNGQIWQQTEYHYHYHYAFMPDVLIFKSAGRYKMKVEGTDAAVGVTQLK
jgi:hypothetical protein